MKNQETLYYIAKEYSDHGDFENAKRIIYSMDDTNGQNQYRIWAYYYMKRRISEQVIEVKGNNYKKQIDQNQKNAEKLIEQSINNYNKVDKSAGKLSISKLEKFTGYTAYSVDCEKDKESEAKKVLNKITKQVKDSLVNIAKNIEIRIMIDFKNGTAVITIGAK